MAKKLSKKQLKEIQALATKIVNASGVKKRVPAHNVMNKTRGQAVKEAHAALYGKPKAKATKPKEKQGRLKFK